MKSQFLSLVLGALPAMLLSSAAAADKPGGYSGVLDTGVELFVTTTTTVESVDLATRELTLKGNSGHPVTLTVDPRVKRLNEISPGDTVSVDYYVSAASEFRAPTDEEKANPLVLLGESTKAGDGAAPSGATLRVYKVVATVEGLDRSNASLTIKGPRGKYHTVQVKYLDRLSLLKIGDSIVVTYTEALAVAVTKTNKPTDPKQPAPAATATAPAGAKQG